MLLNIIQQKQYSESGGAWLQNRMIFPIGGDRACAFPVSVAPEAQVRGDGGEDPCGKSVVVVETIGGGGGGEEVG